MKTTKTVKTTLTIETTTAELKKNLSLYQTDMVAELMAEYRKENGEVSFRDASKVAAICFHRGKEFRDLIEKTGTPWLDTPTSRGEWLALFKDFPFVLGITDDDITPEVKEVILILNGTTYNVSEVIDSI